MTQTRHTPGPWRVVGESGDSKRIYVESDMERDNWECLRCEVDSDDCDYDMAHANARLIAAAPQLLAACERFCRNGICSCADGGPGFVCDVCEGCAAIAAAKGGAA